MVDAAIASWLQVTGWSLSGAGQRDRIGNQLQARLQLQSSEVLCEHHQIQERFLKLQTVTSMLFLLTMLVSFAHPRQRALHIWMLALQKKSGRRRC